VIVVIVIIVVVVVDIKRTSCEREKKGKENDFHRGVGF